MHVPAPRRQSWIRGRLRQAGLGALAAAATLIGCIDPAGKYDRFVERALQSDDGGRADPGDGGDAELPEPEQLTGRYLLAVTFDQYPDEPTAYELELEAERTADSYEVSLRQRPLRFEEYMTPVGDWSDWLTAELTEQGVYENPEAFEVLVPASANPLRLPAEVDLFLRGSVIDGVEGDDGKMEFWCGEAWGTVTALGISMPAEGGFTAARIREGEAWPQATIGCDAEPVGSP